MSRVGERFLAGCLIVTSLAVGLAFVLAGLWKIQNPANFMIDVSRYELTSPGVSVVIASVLPWLEVLVGLSVAFRLCVKEGLVIAVILLTAFILAQISAISRGLEIGCACFGPESVGSLVSPASVLRTSGILALVILCWAGMRVSANQCGAKT